MDSIRYPLATTTWDDAEYAALFQAAGFALARVFPTPAGPSVVEAVPV